MDFAVSILLYFDTFYYLQEAYISMITIICKENWKENALQIFYHISMFFHEFEDDLFLIEVEFDWIFNIKYVNNKTLY